ncbi:MAG: hypothetical protein KA371_21345 [Acidobacteria bacterium]|nr:hypothetical protein [Acidobacteriota bacterium]
MEARISILHGPAAPDRRRLVAAVALLCVSLGPGLAAQASSSSALGSHDLAPAEEPGLHAIRGLVVSITPALIVVRRSGLRGGEMALAITERTARDGEVVAGAVVAVRYRIIDDVAVAIAIAVRRPPR